MLRDFRRHYIESQYHRSTEVCVRSVKFPTTTEVIESLYPIGSVRVNISEVIIGRKYGLDNITLLPNNPQCFVDAFWLHRSRAVEDGNHSKLTRLADKSRLNPKRHDPLYPNGDSYQWVFKRDLSSSGGIVYSAFLRNKTDKVPRSPFCFFGEEGECCLFLNRDTVDIIGEGQANLSDQKLCDAKKKHIL